MSLEVDDSAGPPQPRHHAGVPRRRGPHQGQRPRRDGSFRDMPEFGSSSPLSRGGGAVL
ncbi:unnamed protein product [Spirodela intermedia]|uniref:Uncharacterized protein n=2 Tax=Spirodela intermedia TaxID=51605 RepID=A0A7I8I7I9_SPIIN|nr:unnamed protein product [Spirodela intermedia]CAA6653530.1 unnamed protein product [Spirodela intermedia]CAA7387796.1 unnamed protein product [Spirodela intermedia]